eukprot:TRINITY_DN47611_c0_g1_i1.p1 TRINITY_DN47611_c0_g1~~TRINITY_DN47611_c0_g1_i1.p1  ORF type:complete len:300 (+),score=91.91 TRINITY_DN47611_c0_g1_i1:45-944(+)
MRGLSLACVVICSGLVVSQEIAESTAAPVEIVKQVNEINEDGSYTVGYEASDGTFKLETRDTHGNVEGKYGFIDDNGGIKIVEYSSNNITGFSTDLTGPVDNSVAAAVTNIVNPAFALEQERHNAVLAHQKSVVARQQQIAQQRELDAQRQTFANQPTGAQRFNAASFNPQQPAAAQFNQQNFQQFQQQPQRFAPQQPSQFQGQSTQNQQFSAPRSFQPQQQAFQPQQPSFSQAPQFRSPQPVAPQAPQLSQAQLNQLFTQSNPTQQQQFAPQQQQFAPQQQQFAPQSRFAPQQQFFGQ